LPNVTFLVCHKQENFGDDNALALFQKILELYGAEFDLVGNEVRLYKQIGYNTDFQFRYKHNIKTLSKTIKTDNLSTYIKGYGKQNDDGTYVATAEYTSPMAAIYGIRHAEPVYDERFTNNESLLEYIKSKLQDTPEISITIEFVDLAKAGYPLPRPRLGDTVYLIYEPLGIDITTRIMEITDYPESDRSPEVTLANFKESFADVSMRYTKSQIEKIYNEQTGRIRYTVLDEAVKQATEALQSAQTELKFDNGIIAIDKNDQNNIVLFNSAGIGISDDGGQTFRTAMTGSGIVADVITAGTLRGITVISDDGQGNSVTIESGSIVSKINNRDMVKIHNYEIYFYDPGNASPSPDYGVVATLSSSWKDDNPNARGFGIVGYKDYFYVGLGESDTNAKHFFEINFSESKTYLYGEGRDEKTIGRLDLYSVRSRAYNYQTSQISIENNYYNNTRWGGVFVYTGRGTESPGGANKRFGFEVWQYDGSGGLNQHLIIDKGSNGKSYTGIYTDEAWLPNQSYLEYKDGYYYNALGIGIDSDVINRRGSLNGNALLFVDYWDFNVDPNVRYQSGRYNMNGAENVFAVFVQPMGSNSVYYNARAYNISSTGFDVYVAKNDASDTPSATQIQLQLIIIYEPKA